MSDRTTLNYTLWSFGPTALLIAVLGIAFSTAGATVAGLLSIPWLAWRYDNDSGTYLVLAVLFLLVLAVPALLLVLMAVTH